MATDDSFPPVPSNYVTIRDLQERWMKRQQQELERRQQPMHEPTLPQPQPQPRNHVPHGKESSCAAAIAPPSNRSDSAMAVTQAEKSRVSEVEQSALVAVEETGTTRVKKSKWRKKKKKKKKKFGIDGKGKLDEDADGGTEHAPAGKVAEESVSSTDLSKDGTIKVEVKCVSTESKPMQQLQSKINSPSCAWVRKVAGEDDVAIEKKVSKNDLGSVKIQKGGLDTESQKNVNPANPTFKMESEFEKLSMRDDKRGYRWGGNGGGRGVGYGGGRGRGRGGGRGGGWGRPSRVSEMVWVKKV